MGLAALVPSALVVLTVLALADSAALEQGEQHTHHANDKPAAGSHQRHVHHHRSPHRIQLNLPENKPGRQEIKVDGVTRVFSINISEPLWCNDESEQDCGPSLKITVNGKPVTLQTIKPAIHSKEGPDVFTVQVDGTCGPFKGTNIYYLRKGRSDIYVFWMLFVQDTFFWTRSMFNSSQISRILDLGANIGLSVSYWATQYPEAQIIAVEPELGNFGMLTFNAGHHRDIFLERAAVTRRLGWSLKSHVGDGGDWASVEKPTDGIENTDSFKAVTIPYLLNKYRWDYVDILKIDIEGSERDVCQDILDNMSANHWINKVACVTMETHDWFFPNATVPVTRLCDIALTGAGLTFVAHYYVDSIHLWCRH